MKQCPICKIVIKNKMNRLCVKCGWEFKFSASGMPLPDNDTTKLQIKIYQRNWKALKSLASKHKELSKQKHALEKKLHEIYYTLDEQNTQDPEDQNTGIEDNDNLEDFNKQQIESTTLPDHLIKSHFETEDEFRNRIDNLDAMEAGAIRILKKKYVPESKQLPLRVIFNEWVKLIEGIPRVNVNFYCIADDTLVNTIFETASKYDLFLKLKVFEDRISVGQLEFHVSGQAIPIKMMWVEPVTGMEFIWIPGGTFMMGSPKTEAHRFENESPMHEVVLDGFWMGKYPVTQSEFKQILGVNRSNFQLGLKYPAEKVSWNDTQDFIKKLTEKNNHQIQFRLPTEAEWEYACRAMTSTAYHFGKSLTEEQSNINGVKGCTSPVGEYEPNAFGLFDMHGNVWEWCQDTYSDHAYKKHPKKNPVYAYSGSNRVIRGGCWYREAEVARSAYRYGYSADLRTGTIGFRMVRNA